MPPRQNKPRVLIITRNLPPLVGGMETLMLHLVRGVNSYAEVTVIGPRGSTNVMPEGVRIREAPAGMFPFLLFSTWAAVIACRKTPFDRVIGGSGLVAPVLKVLKLFFGVKTVVFLHGLDVVVNSTIYQRLFLPCIRQTAQVIANSTNTRRLAIERGVPQERIAVINPGTRLPETPQEKTLDSLRERYAISFGKVLIFVGRMTRRKGLSAFIENSLPAILAAEPTAGLIVVGDNPDDSLNKLGEQKEVLATVERLGVANRVMFLGHVSDEELVHCYATADVQIFPLIDVPGDVEGFGMIAIEAAACGTPTVAFDLGGVSDAVSASNGRLVTPQHYDLFTDAIIETLRTGVPDRKTCISHAENFSWPVFNDRVKKTIFGDEPAGER